MYVDFNEKTHRLIPSRYPPVSLFDWADSAEELEQIALLEGLTNDRLKQQYGNIHSVKKEDWIGGDGSTSLMAAFTHPGESRFSDGRYGIYYAGDSIETAIAETRFHRQLFLSASNEAPCLIQMREYTAFVTEALVKLNKKEHADYLKSDLKTYQDSQAFGSELRQQNEWGLLYPSVRRRGAKCVAIFRPPALTMPTQGRHLDYIWDGESISEIRVAESVVI